MLCSSSTADVGRYLCAGFAAYFSIMNLSEYLQRSGLAIASTETDAVQARLSGLQQQLQDFLAACDPQVSWQYQVPELGEGGSCSIFGQLAAEPYQLSELLGEPTPASQAMLKAVSALVQFYRQHSRSDWFGVYLKRSKADGSQVLVKLAYFGAPSRAEFPLTAEFAAISNNSTVGLSGRARIINDVASYVSSGGEYYTCDPKVKSEACLPLYSEAGEVIGIVDSEAFAAGLFEGAELDLLLAIVLSLPALLSV